MAIKIDKADKVFSEYIRTRDKWTCQRCGTKYIPPTTALHCSHFQGRGKEATRFDEENADALCFGCHQYFTSYPAEHYLWQVKRKGQNTVLYDPRVGSDIGTTTRVSKHKLAELNRINKEGK